jgi:hypothetical protein
LRAGRTQNSTPASIPDPEAQEGFAFGRHPPQEELKLAGVIFDFEEHAADSRRSWNGGTVGGVGHSAIAVESPQTRAVDPQDAAVAKEEIAKAE